MLTQIVDNAYSPHFKAQCGLPSFAVPRLREANAPTLKPAQNEFNCVANGAELQTRPASRVRRPIQRA